MRRLFRFLLWLLALWFGLTFSVVLLLRWIDPPTSSFMLRARFAAWHAHDTTFRFEHQWVAATRISPNLKLAVIASEDQRFPTHWGFDVESINKALAERQSGKRVRGASTLSQQVAKNLFLWPGKSWIRKGIESYFTVLIELLWSKQRILEVYLNIAEFGKGTYGAEAASQRFFRKPAARLSAQEAALLAAVLPNPIRLQVVAPSRYVRSRQDWILGVAYLKRLEDR
jgi:monofunctional biosynthetic peptidoglycan transglycosylase